MASNEQRSSPNNRNASNRDESNRGPANNTSDAASKNARRVAATVLVRVFKEESYATLVLDSAIREHSLDARDAAFATDLVYGVLRQESILDAWASKYLKQRSTKGLDEHARVVLLCGGYEMKHHRAPSFAIVSSWVNEIRRARGEGLARLCNAVLRRFSEERPSEPLPVTRVAFAPWLAELLEREMGPFRAKAFVMARPLPPPASLRLHPDANLSELKEQIEAQNPRAEFRAGTFSDRILLSKRSGNLREVEVYQQGLATSQDEGSHLIASALPLETGNSVLDACAGRGGKTLALLERGISLESLWAADTHPTKLSRLREQVEHYCELHQGKIALPSNFGTHGVDWTLGDGGIEGRFDRILVDAPCTGTGTMHRRPEIARRLSLHSVAELARIQRAILDRAITLLKPDGILVFAICSVLPSEFEAGLSYLRGRDDLRVVPAAFAPDITRAPQADSDGVYRVGPWNDAEGDEGWGATDGYQFVCVQRI